MREGPSEGRLLGHRLGPGVDHPRADGRVLRPRRHQSPAGHRRSGPLRVRAIVRGPVDDDVHLLGRGHVVVRVPSTSAGGAADLELLDEALRVLRRRIASAHHAHSSSSGEARESCSADVVEPAEQRHRGQHAADPARSRGELVRRRPQPLPAARDPAGGRPALGSYPTASARTAQDDLHQRDDLLHERAEPRPGRGWGRCLRGRTAGWRRRRSRAPGRRFRRAGAAAAPAPRARRADCPGPHVEMGALHEPDQLGARRLGQVAQASTRRDEVVHLVVRETPVAMAARTPSPTCRIVSIIPSR